MHHNFFLLDILLTNTNDLFKIKRSDAVEQREQEKARKLWCIRDRKGDTCIVC